MAWIGVDFDGTLAVNNFAPEPEPVMPMVERVRTWLANGHEVRIFTARAALGARGLLHEVDAFCERHFGRRLPITNVKDHEMLELWDDRAVRVLSNLGVPCCVRRK